MLRCRNASCFFLFPNEKIALFFFFPLRMLQLDVVFRRYGIQHAIQLSRSVYNDAIAVIKDQDDAAFKSVCEIKDRHQVDLLQSESSLDKLYEDAKEARENVLAVFASEWEEFKRVDEGKTVLSRPRAGQAAEWVDTVIDPGHSSKEGLTLKLTCERFMVCMRRRRTHNFITK